MPERFRGTTPELTVAAVVERNGRFMMVEERVGGRLVINQPAGHVESGEALLDAVVREALEETAWSIAAHAICGIYLWKADDRPNPFLRVAFAARCIEQHAARALDTGIVRVLWLSRDELAARPMKLRSPMVMRAVDDYLAGQRYPLDLIQESPAEQIAVRAAVL